MTDINTSLLVQMRATARDANGIGNEAEKVAESNFDDILKNFVDGVNESQQRSVQVAKDFSMERGDVGLADAMLAMQEARIHFQSMVQIRNQLVKAYEEIMRMPV